MGIRLIVEEKSYLMKLEDIVKLQTKAGMFKRHGIPAKLSSVMTIFVSGDTIASPKLWVLQDFLASKYGLDYQKIKFEFIEEVKRLQWYWEIQRIFQAYSVLKGEENGVL